MTGYRAIDLLSSAPINDYKEVLGWAVNENGIILPVYDTIILNYWRTHALGWSLLPDTWQLALV